MAPRFGLGLSRPLLRVRRAQKEWQYRWGETFGIPPRPESSERTYLIRGFGSEEAGVSAHSQSEPGYLEKDCTSRKFRGTFAENSSSSRFATWKSRSSLMSFTLQYRSDSFGARWRRGGTVAPCGGGGRRRGCKSRTRDSAPRVPGREGPTDTRCTSGIRNPYGDCALKGCFSDILFV